MGHFKCPIFFNSRIKKRGTEVPLIYISLLEQQMVFVQQVLE